MSFQPAELVGQLQQIQGVKRWLVASDEKNTPDLVEKEYEKFARNLQWSMIKGKLAGQFKLEVAVKISD